MSINFIVTDGASADCKEAIHLIKDINAKLVFADLALKCWRSISTRYTKTLDAFIAFIFVRCIFLSF